MWIQYLVGDRYLLGIRQDAGDVPRVGDTVTLQEMGADPTGVWPHAFVVERVVWAMKVVHNSVQSGEPYYTLAKGQPVFRHASVHLAHVEEIIGREWTPPGEAHV